MAVRWGILGCGRIAGAFAKGLAEAPGATLAAVGSRTAEKAQKFAEEYGAAQAFGSYAELAASGEVDAVYVATPHPMHRDDALLCLENGKAVLCEKPFAINASQAAEMVAAARSRNVFLMEAMWTRFFPLMERLRELVQSGKIGDVRVVEADFGFQATFDPHSRLFDPVLGGGALLDVGVYTISFASMLLGRAESVTGTMHPTPTGVDGLSAFILHYNSGALASLYTSIEVSTPIEAKVIGSAGHIRIHSPFFKPDRMTVSTPEGEETLDFPFAGNGYQFEAMEVGRCLAEGKIESPTMPHDETVAIMETMDAIRGQWNLKYPSE